MSRNEIERWFDGYSEEDLEDSEFTCPVCGSVLKNDPWGGVFQKCFKCGWAGMIC